jgi:hypothetical protein
VLHIYPLQPQGHPPQRGILRVHEFHRLDGQDFSQKEEKDIQWLLETALHMLLVAGSTPDVRQRLGANEEGIADRPVLRYYRR